MTDLGDEQIAVRLFDAENDFGATCARTGQEGDFVVWNITIPRSPAPLMRAPWRTQRITVANETAKLRWSIDTRKAPMRVRCPACSHVPATS